MPELPEVETTTRGLQTTVRGRKITALWCGWENMFRGASSKHIAKKVLGMKFVAFERRGKNILAHLSSGDTLIMHMKMTGHFMYGAYSYNKKQNTWRPTKTDTALSDPYNRFVHVVFSLSGGKQLVFCDARKFGKIELVKTSDLSSHIRVGTLGPEPLEKDFTYKVFKECLVKKQGLKIKPVLLDQTIIAGIGNIYADESLHAAGIHPERKVSSLSEAELKLLRKTIIASLKKGLHLGGDSTSDYRNIYGEHGQSQHTHNVYRQTGRVCKKSDCAGIIERIVVAARGTHICLLCQPKN